MRRVAILTALLCLGLLTGSAAAQEPAGSRTTCVLTGATTFWADVTVAYIAGGVVQCTSSGAPTGVQTGTFTTWGNRSSISALRDYCSFEYRGTLEITIAGVTRTVLYALPAPAGQGVLVGYGTVRSSGVKLGAGPMSITPVGGPVECVTEFSDDGMTFTGVLTFHEAVLP